MAVIKPKRTSTSGNTPTTSNLEVGEIAINLADKRIYVRDSSDNIFDLTELVSDTSPQLGGNLDGQAYDFTTTGEIDAGTLTVNGVFTFPTSDGTSNQVLVTDGNGSLSWATQSGGTGDSLGYDDSTITAQTMFVDGSEDFGNFDAQETDAFGETITLELLDLSEPANEVITHDLGALS